MTSKISFYNIAKEDLRGRFWMLALSILGNFLALPISFLLANRNYRENSITILNNKISGNLLFDAYKDFFTADSLFLQGGVLILGALIVGICGSRYLYSRKKSDLFHALPIKRGHFFLINWLNGVLIYLIPMLICTLLTLLFMFVNLVQAGSGNYFGELFLIALKEMGILIVLYLSIYHLCLVCVAFSGNALNALCATIVFGFFIMCVYGLVYALSGTFLDTFISMTIHPKRIVWMSPIFSVFWILIEPMEGLLLGVKEVASYASLILNMMIVVLVTNLGLAYFLTCRRPSELAGRGIKLRSAGHMLRVMISFLAGVCGAYIFYFIVNTRNGIGWFLFGAILAGGFTFGVADVILNMNFRSFFAHKIEMAASILLACLFFFTFLYDWTGFDTRIPEKDQIVSASIRTYQYNDNSESYMLDQYGNLVSRTGWDYIPAIDYTDVDVIWDMLTALSAHEQIRKSAWYSYFDYMEPADYDYAAPLEYSRSSPVTVQVKLKNGSTFLRSYYYTEKELELLRPIIESDVYRDTFFCLSTGGLGIPEYLEVSSEINSTDYETTTEEQRSLIMEAYQKDFLANYKLETIKTGLRVAKIGMRYNYNGFNRYFYLYVYENYTNTLEAIRSIFPDIPFSLENASINSISMEVRLEYDDKYGTPTPFTRESLASYFGLEGYPDFLEYVNSLHPDTDEEADKMEGTSQDNTKPFLETAEGYDRYFPYLLTLTFTDAEDIRALLPYIHAGNYQENPMLTGPNEYISFGNGTTSTGRHFSCYVKPGELPIEWIDRLLEKGTYLQ